MNNLPRVVVTQPRTDLESNSRPLDRKSDVLALPLRHIATPLVVTVTVGPHEPTPPDIGRHCPTLWANTLTAKESERKRTMFIRRYLLMSATAIYYISFAILRRLSGWAYSDGPSKNVGCQKLQPILTADNNCCVSAFMVRCSGKVKVPYSVMIVGGVLISLSQTVSPWVDKTNH